LPEELSLAPRKTTLLSLLARGEKEIAEGIGHNLKDILADADELLAQD
jgi:hypothetical protein